MLSSLAFWNLLKMVYKSQEDYTEKNRDFRFCLNVGSFVLTVFQLNLCLHHKPSSVAFL